MKQPTITLDHEYKAMRDKMDTDANSIDIFVPMRVDIPPKQTVSFAPDFSVDLTETGVLGMLLPVGSLGARTAYILKATLVHTTFDGVLNVQLFNPTDYPIELLAGEKVAQLAFFHASPFKVVETA